MLYEPGVFEEKVRFCTESHVVNESEVALAVTPLGTEKFTTTGVGPAALQPMVSPLGSVTTPPGPPLWAEITWKPTEVDPPATMVFPSSPASGVESIVFVTWSA